MALLLRQGEHCPRASWGYNAPRTHQLVTAHAPQDPSTTQDPARHTAVGAPANPAGQAPEQVVPLAAGTVQLKGEAFSATTLGRTLHVPAATALSTYIIREDVWSRCGPDKRMGCV